VTPAGSTYHHGDLRAALVQTATELARADGPDGVVLRETARRVGVSHNAAYRHFADRTALLSAVAHNALAELAAAMRAAQAAEDRRRSHRGDPAARARGRLRALGQTYVDFALAQPGLFRVAFQAELKESGPEDAEPFNLLGEALDDLVAAGVLTAQERAGAEMMCWSAVHGFALLVLDGPLREVPAEERDQALTAMLDALDHGL
jgi:AcrR family transcriptional regulator